MAALERSLAEKVKPSRRRGAHREGPAALLRDALSLLDQAMAFADGKVTAETVAGLLGALPEDILLASARAILGKDAAALARELARVEEDGFDPSELLKDLRERLQGLYRRSLGIGADPGPGWSELCGHPPETYSFLIKRLNGTLEDLRGSDTPQLAFELGVYGLLESAYDLRGWVQRPSARAPTAGARRRRPFDYAFGFVQASGAAAPRPRFA